MKKLLLGIVVFLCVASVPYLMITDTYSSYSTNAKLEKSGSVASTKTVNTDSKINSNYEFI